MKSALIWCFSASLLICSSVTASDTSKQEMHIDGIKFTLCTPKADVSDMLQGAFHYQEIGTSLFLTSKAGPPYEQKGYLGFKEGKLATISRSFVSASDRDAFETLFQLLESRGLEGEQPARIAHSHFKNDKLNSKTVSISYGNRTIYLSITRGDNYNEVASLSECIGICQSGKIVIP